MPWTTPDKPEAAPSDNAARASTPAMTSFEKMSAASVHRRGAPSALWLTTPSPASAIGMNRSATHHGRSHDQLDPEDERHGGGEQSKQHADESRQDVPPTLARRPRPAG